MKKQYAALAVAAAAVFAVPAFAQSSVTSSTGASVSSGTGVIVTPSLPSASVTVAPAADVNVTASGPHLLPGATLVQSGSTTVMGSGPVVTQTVVTNYWANVPAGFERRGDVQRWMSLR
jgi:hypothetical protein